MRDTQRRWPLEPPSWLDSGDSLRDAMPDDRALRRAVLAAPDDDEPRRAYAEWMSQQDHEGARAVGAFVRAQLQTAAAFRTDRKANVTALRRWNGEGQEVRPGRYISAGEFRGGDTLRAWFASGLGGLPVGWPHVYRGFVERVWLSGRRFLEIAPELFQVAPIRHLVLVGVAEVVDELAACRYLRRIRSLSLPRWMRGDELTDHAFERLIASPHLMNIVHLRLVHQAQLTPRAYARAVTASTLPLLSCFDVFEPRDEWELSTSFDVWTRCERMMAFDTLLAVVRSQEWIGPLEHQLGEIPCLHPEAHYGIDPVDLEAIAENPIALDARITPRRGLGVHGIRHQRGMR